MGRSHEVGTPSGQTCRPSRLPVAITVQGIETRPPVRESRQPIYEITAPNVYGTMSVKV